MIAYSLTDAGVLTLRPTVPLEAVDFIQVTAEVDAWLETGKKLRGVLIDAPWFPGWKDFHALAAHLRFIKDHHRKVARVALVTDSAGLSMVPKLAKHFVSAKLRHFQESDRAAAEEWVRQIVNITPQQLIYSWLPEEKLLVLSVIGKITTGEYLKFLEWLKEVIAEQSPVSCVLNIDHLEGAELGAMMADLKFGLAHIKDFKRIALIGDEKWIHRIAAMPNPFPIEIRAFDEWEEDEAWDWAAAPGTY